METNDHTMSENVYIVGTERSDCEGRLNFRRIPPLTKRRSIRRYWNQLPHFQRSLIVLIITTFCIALVLFLPGDNTFSKTESNKLEGLFSNIDRQSNFPNVVEKYHFEDSEDTKTKNEVIPDEVNVNAIPKNEHDIHQNIANNANVADFNESKENLNVMGSIFTPTGIGESPGTYKVLENPALKEALKDPSKIPGSNGVPIEEFVLQLKPQADNQILQTKFKGPTNQRQKAVVSAFKHSWESYKKYAWGQDNLLPISMDSSNWFNLGLTIVDSLDTILIMGLEEEFLEARQWVKESLKFDFDTVVSLFEVTIRVLGGLLSAYHLSGDKMFLEKSIELSNRLLPCFLTPSGIPYSAVNLASMSAFSQGLQSTPTSEATTIQLEFRDLSRITNVPIYEEVIDIVNDKVHTLEKMNGLAPILINVNTGSFHKYAPITLGGRGDSYYEYLLKQWIQKGCNKNDYLITDYMQAIDGVITQLMRRTPRENLVYIGEIQGDSFLPKMEHLACFLPGTLLLGHKYGMPDSHLHLANDLLETCYRTYMKQPTKLAPEVSYFSVTIDDDEVDIYVKSGETHNLLRPEFIESLYYFYALTGNRTYQKMGWTIFKAFEKYTKVDHGYTSIGDVRKKYDTQPKDMMETFWLAETLKYFYLLFSDNRKEIDLDKFVFNTEAHPLPILSVATVVSNSRGVNIIWYFLLFMFLFLYFSYLYKL